MFGFGVTNSTFSTHTQRSGGLIQESEFRSINEQSNISSGPRSFRLESRNEKFNSGFGLRNNGRLNQNFTSLADNEMSHLARNNTLQYSTLRSGSLLGGDNIRANHESAFASFRSRIEPSNMYTMSGTFAPAERNTLMNGGQGRPIFNEEENNNDGFRRPLSSTLIRGRNPITSSRLFSHQSVERNYKDLSNINGLNGAHISKRGLDTMSESRLGFDTRHNWMDNHSVTGSVVSVASVKAQFINMLENLHHSILNIVPNVPVEMVRMEFDKVKEGLECISEMSFAAGTKENDAVSVLSHSSKPPCAPISELTSTRFLDRSSAHLKTGKDVLQRLMSKKTMEQNITNQLEGRLSSANFPPSDEEREESPVVFKKPKSIPKKSKISQNLKIKTPHATKNLNSNVKKTMINLKQWYPIASGTELAFCGVDEEGTIIKTDAVKKRVTNRKLELINGLDCNLIGSPSNSIVSVLPKKIMTLITNGLTQRWRVFQKELLSCQTKAKGERQKRDSKSPGKNRLSKTVSPSPSSSPSPVKAGKKAKTSKRKGKKSLSPGKSSSPKKVSRPKPSEKAEADKKKSSDKSVSLEKIEEESLKKKRHKLRDSLAEKEATPKRGKKKRSPPKKTKMPLGKEFGGSSHSTRSGRTVKPPSMFWIVAGSADVTSSLVLSTPRTTITGDVKSVEKSWKTDSETPQKKSTNQNKRPKKVSTAVKRIRKSSEKLDKKARNKLITPKKKSPKKIATVAMESEEEEEEDEVDDEEARVDSVSTSSEKRKKVQVKRKRGVAMDEADADATLTKKSRSEKFGEAKVESTVEDTENSVKSSKKTTKTARALSSNSKEGKSGRPKQKKEKTLQKTVKENSKEVMETSEMKSDFEGDFELDLDDIEIPEIAVKGGKPQLSRSQLRIISMETPPLKYFNSNLKLLRSATPVRSPDWCISQRTDSEVKQYEKRRAEAFRKKVTVEVTKNITKEKSSNPAWNKEMKKVLEWVADRDVNSPQWNSKLLRYVIPSRKQLEQEDEEKEDEMENECDLT